MSFWIAVYYATREFLKSELPVNLLNNKFRVSLDSKSLNF